MAKRLGTVLIFKKGVTREAAAAALAALRGLLAEEFLEYPKKATGEEDYNAESHTVPYRLEEYDDTRSGGPVWYIP